MAVIDFGACGVAKARRQKRVKRLAPELKRLRAATYADVRASVCVPNDRSIVHVVEAAVALKKKLNPALIVVVGIGGSNLGAEAVLEALRGSGQRRVLWADTVDSDALSKIVQEMQDVLRSGRQVIVNVISKSGGTLETIANFEVLLNVLRRHRKNAHEFVMVTTDKGSKLWELAIRNRYSLLEIPKNVGGRYSVFTAVGLFPLGLAGVDIRELVGGARDMLAQCLEERGPAAEGAAVLYEQYNSGRTIHDFFVFAKDLEALGKWYRQLLAESTGKEFDQTGKRVRAGLTPTVSVGSTDLHSMGQLYLGGPRNKSWTMVTAHFQNEVTLPNYAEFNKIVPNLQKRSVHELMRAIAQGTMRTYKKQGLPYVHVKLAGKTEREIGALMQWKMVETILLAKLMNVNPFDQPSVESYKKEARKLLSR
ncbi:hypothetical protein C4580_00080 [Candidatus Woesearchaeota archaeon]|nr:MAG: hypothetical protein C4580_00080 [Candidatus Woesearchaeota archaeon]